MPADPIILPRTRLLGTLAGDLALSVRPRTEADDIEQHRLRRMLGLNPVISIPGFEASGKRRLLGSTDGLLPILGPDGYLPGLGPPPALITSDPDLQAAAAAAVNDFIRTRMREDGFFRRIMPPLPIDDRVELDRAVPTDGTPLVVPDATPAQAAAEIAARDQQFRQRVQTEQDRIQAQIRRVTEQYIGQTVGPETMNNLAQAVEQVLRQTSGGSVSVTAVPNPADPNSITVSVNLSRPMVPEEVHLVLPPPVRPRIVPVTVRWPRYETIQRFMGRPWTISVDPALNPDRTVHQFADPSFIGNSYVLEDTSVYVRREAYMMEFYAYDNLGGIGGAVGNMDGLARANFGFDEAPTNAQAHNWPDIRQVLTDNPIRDTLAEDDARSVQAFRDALEARPNVADDVYGQGTLTDARSALVFAERLREANERLAAQYMQPARVLVNLQQARDLRRWAREEMAERERAQAQALVNGFHEEQVRGVSFMVTNVDASRIRGIRADAVILDEAADLPEFHWVQGERREVRMEIRNAAGELVGEENRPVRVTAPSGAVGYRMPTPRFTRDVDELRTYNMLANPALGEPYRPPEP